jgi:hypothetical protein
MRVDLLQDGKQISTELRVPVLSLVPLTPLTVKEASFKMGMSVSHVAPHRQVAASKRGAAPAKPSWYLVDDPISVRGTIAPPKDEEGASGTIQITVALGPGPVPAGLDKLLTSMTQTGHAVQLPPDAGGQVAPAAAASPGGETPQQPPH